MERLIALLPTLVAALSLPVSAAEFFVAPTGDDAGPGSEARPFATLERARAAVRASRTDAPAPITVSVRGGTYELPGGFALDSRDSGSPGAPVTWRAHRQERPALIGGRQISGFTRHAGSIMEADTASQGFRGARFDLLIFEGRRQELARYPDLDPTDRNGGRWAFADGQRIDMYADRPDEDGYLAAHRHLDFWQRNIPRHTRMLQMRSEDVRTWAHPGDAEISIFPRFNWSHYILPVESFDPATRTLRVGPGSPYEIRAGDRYFVRGPLEELDRPGEWHHDPRTGTLYFWPPSSADSVVAIAPLAASVVQLAGCAHVTLRGFTIECATGSAVVLKNCAHVTVAASTIRNAGNRDGCGVLVDGGHDNAVVGNDIHDVGHSGIRLGGGDPVTLEPGRNAAINNHIHHTGRVGRSGRGIELRGALNRVAHNLIHDTPHGGISVLGVRHTIEFNHLRHTCLETEDSGAICDSGSLGWLAWNGTVVRFNRVEDTVGFGFDKRTGRWTSPYFSHALYPDWAASGVHIYGNLLVRAASGCLHLHSGHGNVVENNILVDGAQSQIDWNGWNTSTGFWKTKMTKAVATYEAAATRPGWKGEQSLRDPRAVPLPDGRVMRDNIFRRNIVSYSHTSSALARFRDVPFEHNICDSNLIHAPGGRPRTGQFLVESERGPNLLANPGLEDGPVGAFPKGWGWMTRLSPATRCAVVEDQPHTGARALLVEPRRSDAGESDNSICHVAPGPEIRFVPGAAYRFAVWVRTDGPPASFRLDVYSWKRDTHNWLVTKAVAATAEWQQVDLPVLLPKPGDPAYKPTMDRLAARLTFPASGSRFHFDDLSLREANLADEWDAWHALGMDRNSILADPLFVDAARGDFRLRPESPAFKLGFQPIPIERIGLYDDDLRASWPVDGP